MVFFELSEFVRYTLEQHLFFAQTTHWRPPLTSRKIPVRWQLAKDQAVQDREVEYVIEIRRGTDPTADNDPALDTASFKLRVINPEQTHKRTFISSIDGSVKYYGSLQ